MVRFKYKGSFCILMIDGKEQCLIPNHTYVFSENDKKVKQLLRLKKLELVPTKTPNLKGNK